MAGGAVVERVAAGVPLLLFQGEKYDKTRHPSTYGTSGGAGY